LTVYFIESPTRSACSSEEQIEKQEEELWQCRCCRYWKAALTAGRKESAQRQSWEDEVQSIGWKCSLGLAGRAELVTEDVHLRHRES